MKPFSKNYRSQLAEVQFVDPGHLVSEIPVGQLEKVLIYTPWKMLQKILVEQFGKVEFVDFEHGATPY